MQELLKSKRFWLAVAGVISTAFGSQLPLSEDQIQQIVMILGAWIIGDSLRQTSPPTNTGRMYR